MKKCQVTLLINEDSVPIIADFEDKDWQILLDFVNYATDLDGLTLVKQGSIVKLGISHESGQSVTFKTELPPDEQIIALMHRLRPFILENEPTNFNRVANILTRKIDNSQFRELIKRLRSTFLATKYRNMFQITVNDTMIVNTEQALQTWLNAFEFHRDQDKRKSMEKVFVMFPENASKAIFVMLLIDKLFVIRTLAPFVMVITNQKDQFTISA